MYAIPGSPAIDFTTRRMDFKIVYQSGRMHKRYAEIKIRNFKKALRLMISSLFWVLHRYISKIYGKKQ